MYDKLYLTVLTNKEGTTNANVYRQLFPQFVNSSNAIVPLTTAVSTLQSNLNVKLTENSTPGTDTDNRIKLLDNVVQFKVRLLKADGTPESGSVITKDTRQIEIELSVLKDEDYRQWLNERGTAATESNTAKEFRALRQSTFTRRIYLSDRSLQEDRYE